MKLLKSKGLHYPLINNTIKNISYIYRNPINYYLLDFTLIYIKKRKKKKKPVLGEPSKRSQTEPYNLPDRKIYTIYSPIRAKIK